MSKYLLLLKNLKTSQTSTAKTALTAPFGSNGSAYLRHISKNKYNESTLAAPVVSNLSINLNTPEIQWQYDFCAACGDFNNWRGQCPLSIGDCLLTRVMDAENDVQKLKGITIGQGIKTDDVLHLWKNEPIEELLKNSLWFICITEYLVMDTSAQMQWENGYDTEEASETL